LCERVDVKVYMLFVSIDLKVCERTIYERKVHPRTSAEINHPLFLLQEFIQFLYIYIYHFYCLLHII